MSRAGGRTSPRAFGNLSEDQCASPLFNCVYKVKVHTRHHGWMCRTFEGVGLPQRPVGQGAHVVRRMRTPSSGQDHAPARVREGQGPHLHHRHSGPPFRQSGGDQPCSEHIQRQEGEDLRSPRPVPPHQADMREEEGRRHNRQARRPHIQLRGGRSVYPQLHEQGDGRDQDPPGRVRQRQLHVRSLLLHPGAEAHELS